MHDNLKSTTKHLNIIMATALVLAWVFWGFGFMSAHGDDIEDLIPSIIMCESGGNPHAVSPVGAIGLFQITPIVLKEWNQHGGTFHEDYGIGFREFIQFNIADLYNVKVNYAIADWYLHRLKNYYLKENYTPERMLHAWNGGITKLRKYNYDCSKMPRESRNFSRKVMRLYRR